MATFNAIYESVSEDLGRLNGEIRRCLRTDNQLMNEVIDGYLRVTGKQIRPMIVLLSARMFGDVTPEVTAAAAAVELLHNASLIHDDVVDNAELRRNAPTINAIWDNHIAVLTGDFFVSTAMQQALLTHDMRVIEVLCSLGKLLSLGELDQIYNARYHKLTEESYFRVISHKTASLFVACAKMGCYAVGASAEQIETMGKFAELLGRCFQIRDDIFDYFPSGKVGKPTGNDLKEGKVTLPLLHVLLDESMPRHDEMVRLAMQESLTDSDIAILTAYAVDNGGIEYAYETMRRLRDRAAALLAPLPDVPAKDDLMSVFDSIISRDY